MKMLSNKRRIVFDGNLRSLSNTCAKTWVAVWRSGGLFCITLASKLNEEKKRMIEKEMATTRLSVTP